MVAKHGPDDFAEMLKRYDRAMNRLVNGDYRLSGRLNYGRLLHGEALQGLQATGTGGNSRSVVSPTGFEPVLPD